MIQRNSRLPQIMKGIKMNCTKDTNVHVYTLQVLERIPVVLIDNICRSSDIAQMTKKNVSSFQFQFMELFFFFLSFNCLYLLSKTIVQEVQPLVQYLNIYYFCRGNIFHRSVQNPKTFPQFIQDTHLFQL